MDATQVIGFLAAALITAANIPQAYVIIRKKSTATISVTTYCLLFLGNSLWLAYGIVKLDWPIIIANSISTMTSGIILILNFSSKRTINKIHQTVIPKSKKKNS